MVSRLEVESLRRGAIDREESPGGQYWLPYLRKEVENRHHEAGFFEPVSNFVCLRHTLTYPI